VEYDGHLARERDTRLLETGAFGELQPPVLNGFVLRDLESMMLAASYK